jgi:hypothetical protein
MKENRMLKIGDTLAILMKDEAYFNEIDTWIKSNNLEIIKQFIDRYNLSMLKDLKMHTEDIIQQAFKEKVINEFDECKKIRIIFNDIDPTRSTKNKKKLLKLCFAEYDCSVLLDGSLLEHKLGEYTLVEDMKPICKNSLYHDRTVEAIVKYQKGTWWLTDPNHDQMNGCYLLLPPQEKYILTPGDQFRIGDLEFRLERYNTAVIEYAKRDNDSEDRYKIIQDMGIDNYVKCSFFAVYDGHKGSH